MNFAQSITYIGDDFTHDQFPERFSNQVYLSAVTKFDSYAYKSNFSIKFTARGEEQYYVNRAPRFTKTGDILIINSDDEVEVTKAQSQDKNLGLSIFLDPELLSGAFDTISKPNNIESNEIHRVTFYPGVISDDEAFQKFLFKILKYYSWRPGIDESAYLNICNQLINFKVRFEKRIRAIDVVKRSTQLEIYKRVSLARDYLLDNVNQSFSLEELSKISCMSKYLLIRKFKEIYGITPQRFHAVIKVEKAKELLRNGNSVTETANYLGFPSIYYFSRIFKQNSGYPPRVFLKS